MVCKEVILRPSRYVPWRKQKWLQNPDIESQNLSVATLRDWAQNVDNLKAAAQNRHLAHWEATVADTRIHGTTKRQVGKVFREVERPALLASSDGNVCPFRPLSCT